jgi:hypothetical protein
MYTTHNNLEHTIKLQEELFRQHLRLRGININTNDDNDTSSEHFYDNIDSETSDIERQAIECRNRSLPWHQKKQRTVRFSLNNDEQQKVKTIPNKIRSNDQYYQIGKRKNGKSSTSKINLAKLTNNKKYHCQHTNITSKKFLLSNMLTVTIT